MNKTALKWIKFSVATFLVAMFFFCFIRQWTEIPRYHTIYISADQDALNTSKHLGDYMKWGTTFAFFTTLSNVIAICVIFVEWGSLGKFKVNKKIKIGAFLYMIITALVFWATIAPFMPWGFDPFFDYENIHEHAIVFLAILWFFLSDKRKIETHKRDYFYVLIFPILYLAMTSAIYFATPENVAVYAFLDFYNFFSLGLSRWVSIEFTIIFIILLLAIFIILYWLLVKLSSKGYNSNRKEGKYAKSNNQKNTI